jgi:hypothetical protein
MASAAWAGSLNDRLALDHSLPAANSVNFGHRAARDTLLRRQSMGSVADQTVIAVGQGQLMGREIE